jgi:nitrogen fixation protein NifU and related proteins
MDSLRELYQQVILDHNKNPRNRHPIEHPTASAKGFNPLCGDVVTVYLAIENGVISDVAFDGKGCAICTASASMMTQALKGKPEAEAEYLFQRMHRMLTAEDQATALREAEGVGKLRVFAGVREFPVRVKCATLPWHTFHAALTRQGEPVSTE